MYRDAPTQKSSGVEFVLFDFLFQFDKLGFKFFFLSKDVSLLMKLPRCVDIILMRGLYLTTKILISSAL